MGKKHPQSNELLAVLLPKGSEAPTIGHDVATSESNMLSYVRCRSYDNKTWQGPKGEGDVSGTRKQTKTCVRVGLAASSFSAAGIDKGDSTILVRVYQEYKDRNGKIQGAWSKWSTEDDQEIGTKSGLRITGIQARLSGTLASDYDLYYRAEVKDGNAACWLGWAKNGQTAGQSNINLEQLEFSLVPKGDPAPPANAEELQGTTAHAKQRWVIERWPCNWPKPAYRF